MSRGLVSSPLVHDASAETASSCASLKEMLVTCYIAKEETLNSCRNIAERLVCWFVAIVSVFLAIPGPGLYMVLESPGILIE